MQAEVLNPRSPSPRASKLESELRRSIVGQDEAIQQIVNVWQVHECGLGTPGRPVASLLLLGPTGTGKTRIVEATAGALSGNERAVIKVDCGEFQHSHEIAKLIGSPPGYLGHRETAPMLSQENLNAHHSKEVKVSFLLFDEIEKGSDALWNLLLGILDKGVLTLGDNRRVDFSQAMIFMTSNLGAAEIEGMLWPKLGFFAGAATERPLKDPKFGDKLKKTAVEAARRRFSPEFLNRIDKVVVFKPLSRDELHQILALELHGLRERILAGGPARAFGLKVSEDSRDYILSQGYDPRYGARHLKRALEKALVQPLANLVATGQVKGGDLVDVDLSEDRAELVFTRRASGVPMPVIAAMFGLAMPIPPQAAAAAAAGSPSRKRSAKSTTSSLRPM